MRQKSNQEKGANAGDSNQLWSEPKTPGRNLESGSWSKTSRMVLIRERIRATWHTFTWPRSRGSKDEK